MALDFLVPTPQKIKIAANTFAAPERVQIKASGACAAAAGILKRDLKELAKDKNVSDGNDYQIYRDRAKEILLKWMEAFKTPEAKAESGYEAAVLLQSNGKFAEIVRLCEKIEKDLKDKAGFKTMVDKLIQSIKN